jgi:hypothetical protein
MKGKQIVYTPRQLAFIKQRKKMPRRKLHAKFVRAFPRSKVSVDHLKSLCQRKGWHTGRDGRIKKGNVPANKGKKMPFNANSAATRFKKGNRTGRANQVYKPIGTERFSKEGYLERKIHDGLPMQSRWRAVHIVNWEKKNGAMPAGHCLKCLDGEKLNVKPSNWELVPRSMLPRLNNRWGRDYDTAPAEVKPTIMAIAKLENRLADKQPRN